MPRAFALGRIGAKIEPRRRRVAARLSYAGPSLRSPRKTSGRAAGCGQERLPHLEDLPGLHALDHHVERLADDHARARRFAEAAAQARPGSVDPARVQTNIVVLDVAGSGWTAAAFVGAAAQRGVRLYPVSPTAVRLVWHLDVDDAGTALAVDALAPLLEQGAPAA